MKKFVLIVMCLSLGMKGMAQCDKKDSCCKRKTSHWMGVQANALIRQVLNFNGSGNTITNPYLFTYSCMSNRRHFGLDVGFGYTLKDDFTSDGNTKSEKHNNDIYARIGPMKMFRINTRFSGTIALHGLFVMLNDRTMTQNDFNSQIETFRTNTTQWGVGAGPCASLRFRIAPRIFIGTEATYYFNMGNRKSSVSSLTVFQGGQMEYSETKTDNDFKEFVPTLPAAIFLNIRF